MSLLQVRVVILADHPLEDIFIHDGDYGHDESHVLMDDLGLKRVKTRPHFTDVSCSGLMGLRREAVAMEL